MTKRPAVLSLLLLLACFAAAEDEEGGGIKPGELEAKVKVEEAKAGELPIRLHAIGMVTSLPEQASALVAIVGGVVSKVCASDGQTVEANAPVVVLDDRPMKEALAKADAALRTAEGDLARAQAYGLDAEQAELDLAQRQAENAASQARKEAERQKALLSEQLSSEKAASEAEQTAVAAELAAKVAQEKVRYFREKGRALEFSRLQAAVDAANADAQTAERSLAAATIRAPRAGRVSGLCACAGQMIDSGKAVAVVTGDGGLAVRSGLSPGDVDQAKIGAKAELPGKDLSGSVCSVGGGVDPDTGLVPVLVAIDKSDHAPRNGETVFLDIETAAPAKGILLPVSAVVVEEEGAHVCTVDGGGISHEVKVTVLARNGRSAVVQAEGLAEGAKVIVEGSFNLPDGAKVVIEKDAAPDPEKGQ